VNKATQAAYFHRIESPTELRPLTDKEAELLGRLLNSEPLIRALTVIYWQSRQIPMEFANMDLLDPKGAREATLAQGQMVGIRNTIEALLQLTEVPGDEEEEESGETEND
jgi:hypothetical protein